MVWFGSVVIAFGYLEGHFAIPAPVTEYSVVKFVAGILIILIFASRRGPYGVLLFGIAPKSNQKGLGLAVRMLLGRWSA